VSITDFVIPPWVRIAAITAMLISVFAAGMQLEHWRMSGQVAEAKQEKAELRADVAQAAQSQTVAVLETERKQTRVNDEVVNDFQTRSAGLEQRIATQRVRQPKRINRACAADTQAAVAASAAPSAEESMPADVGGDAGVVQEGLADQVQADAARDALSLAETIEWACKQGMCEP
jgi:hypothetical protein